MARHSLPVETRDTATEAQAPPEGRDRLTLVAVGVLPWEVSSVTGRDTTARSTVGRAPVTGLRPGVDTVSSETRVDIRPLLQPGSVLGSLRRGRRSVGTSPRILRRQSGSNSGSKFRTRTIPLE